MAVNIIGYFCKRWMRGIETNVETTQTEVRSLNEKVIGMNEQRHSDNVAIRKELHIVEDNLMDKEIRPLWEVMRAETNRILEQHRNDMTGIREEIMELIKRNIKP